MSEFLQRFFKPTHDYESLVFQICFLYFLYKAYNAIFVKPSNRSAYQLIEQDRQIPSYEGSDMQRQDLDKIKQSEAQKLKQQKKEEKDRQKQHEDEERAKLEQAQHAKENSVSLKELMKKEKQNKLQQGKEKSTKAHAKVQHRLYLSALKGFSEDITDFSWNERYMCAASEDKSIKVYHLTDFFANLENPKFIFYNLQVGFATALCISQNEDRIYYSALNQIHVLQFNYNEKKFKLEKTFPNKAHKDQIGNIFIDQHDRFLVTTAEDTYIKVWSLTGTLLKELNTSYGQHYHSGWNLTKNFLVLSAWISDTSIFEIKTNKDHSFKSLEKVMLLRGEGGKITDAQMDTLGNRASIVSKSIQYFKMHLDYVKFFNIGVEYSRKEDTKDLKVLTIAELQSRLQSEGEYVSAAASYTSERQEALYAVATKYDVGIFDKNFILLEVIHNGGNGGIISRLAITEFTVVKKLVCFVWAERDSKVNIFNLSEFQQE